MGNKLNLPWSKEQPDANLPISLAHDIKKEDGWEFLFHTFNGTDVSAKDRNYMAFYNVRTGVLKIFYYLINDPDKNNGGVWNINFINGNKLLNFTPEIADISSVENIKDWACTNAVKSGNKAFHMGWNCFTLPLAYVENQASTITLDILPSCLNTQDVNLFGENNSYSKGMMLTHGSHNSTSSLTGGLSTVFGTEAGKYIENKMPEKSEAKGIVAGAAATIVAYGINKVFSKLTASFSQPTVTKSDLEFTTKGTTETTGTLVFNTSSPILSLRVALPQSEVGKLGNWNLTESPTVYIDPRADYMPSPGDDRPYQEYSYEVRGVSRYKYSIAINPNLKSKMKKYWVDCSLVRYWGNEDSIPSIPSHYTDFGALGVGSNRGFSKIFEKEDLLWGKHLEQGSIYETNMKSELLAQGIYAQYQGPIPIIFVPKVRIYGGQYFNSKNLFLKATLHMITEINGKVDTTISTRTFIPKIEWDPDLYNKLKDVDMKDLIYFN